MRNNVVRGRCCQRLTWHPRQIDDCVMLTGLMSWKQFRVCFYNRTALPTRTSIYSNRRQQQSGEVVNGGQSQRILNRQQLAYISGDNRSSIDYRGRCRKNWAFKALWPWIALREAPYRQVTKTWCVFLRLKWLEKLQTALNSTVVG